MGASQNGDNQEGLEGLKGLSSRHVAFYLLKGAGDACRVVYYLRRTGVDLLWSSLTGILELHLRSCRF